MKAILGLTLVAAVLSSGAFAQQPKSPGKCPTPRQQSSFGICMFDPNVNCVDDSACQGGQICCRSECNKVCMDPEQGDDVLANYEPQSNSDDGVVIKQCPPPSSANGICSFDESINCLEDSACSDGQMCCSEGCNKVCKDPVTFQKLKPEPKNGPTF